MDAEAEEVVNELQLLTEDLSNKENEDNDWSMFTVTWNIKISYIYLFILQKSLIEKYLTRLQIMQIG